jgi:hypothetical protein
VRADNRWVVNGIGSSAIKTYMKIRFYVPSGNYIVTAHCHAWYELHAMTYMIRNIEGDD